LLRLLDLLFSLASGDGDLCSLLGGSRSDGAYSAFTFSRFAFKEGDVVELIEEDELEESWVGCRSSVSELSRLFFFLLAIDGRAAAGGGDCCGDSIQSCAASAEAFAAAVAVAAAYAILSFSYSMSFFRYPSRLATQHAVLALLSPQRKKLRVRLST
jgi:hypothetical protein